MSTLQSTRHQPASVTTGRGRARRRRTTADLVEAGAVAFLVAVTVLFLRDGGAQVLSTGTSASRLVGYGRLTGLVGTALLLIQMLLAARLPLIDRTYGHDRALVAHRRLSRVALPLLLAHATALTLGYAGRDGLSWLTGWLVEPLRLLGGGAPDMVTAFVSMALLVVVAVTSVAAARRRTSHETWHMVHLVGYLGVGLSLPHQLSAGTDIAGHPLTRLVWTALYVGTAGAVVVFRVLLPLIRSARHSLVVESVTTEVPGVVSVVVRGRALRRMPVRAGQYLQWRFLTPGLWAAAHPWSISAAPDGRTLRLTVREPSARDARRRRGAVRRLHDRTAHPAPGAARGGRHRDHPGARHRRGAGRHPRHPRGRRHRALPRRRRALAGPAQRARAPGGLHTGAARAAGRPARPGLVAAAVAGRRHTRAGRARDRPPGAPSA